MDELAQTLRGVMPPGMVLAATDPQNAGVLWPGEDLPDAVPKRRIEFSAGRTAARQAMADLGVPAAAIPVGPQRQPLWPQGVVGSISHCAGACLAVVGLESRFAGIGVDVEPLAPIACELWPSLLRPEEHAALPPRPEDQGLAVLRIFIAKEAAFKLQFPLTGRLPDFTAMSVKVNETGFVARLATDAPPLFKADRLCGRFVRSATHLAALTWLGRVAFAMLQRREEL